MSRGIPMKDPSGTPSASKRNLAKLIVLGIMICTLTACLSAEPQETRAAVNLDFPPGGGCNTSFNLTLPRNSTVLVASLNLTGIAIGPPEVTTSYSYTDTTNNSAWSGKTTSGTPSGAPTNYQDKTFSVSDYTNVTASDDFKANTLWDFSNSGGQASVRAYHHFQFKFDPTGATNLTVLWEGRGYSDGGNPQSADLFIYNHTQAAWNTVGSYSINDGKDHNITKYYTANIDDFFSANNELNIVVIGPSRLGQNDPAAMLTDLVYVNVTKGGQSFPSDLALDVGDDGSVDWSAPAGPFCGNLSLGDPEGLKGILQAKVDAAGAGPGTVTILFNISSSSQGRLEISNVTLTYNLPPTAATIPDTYQLNEDSSVPGLIPLDIYFDDDGGDGSLGYCITYKEDASKLDASLNASGHGLDIRTTAPNWYGAMQFRVKATDSLGRSMESNTFKVTVVPIPDAPVLASISPQLAMQDTLFSLTVDATDNDTTLDPSEKLTFSDDTSLFDINSSTGKISFTPSNADVGVHNVTITVKDVASLSDSKVFRLTVQNKNDPPVIDAIADKQVKVGETLNITVTARDPDMQYGEVLIFSDDTALFDIVPTTGAASYTGAAKDIGTHAVTITVTDSLGVNASTKFNISVWNDTVPPPPPPPPPGNRPPVITGPGDLKATEDSEFVQKMLALDPDGDALLFSDDSILFDINATTGEIRFTPNNSQVGVHQVKIDVWDPFGQSASVRFNLTVENVNDAPNAAIFKPVRGQVYGAKETVVLNGRGEDVDLGDRLNYTWKDGAAVLGYGEQLNVTGLKGGNHTITFEVRDLAGATATASVNVSVKKVARPQNTNLLPGPSVLATAGALGTVSLIAAFFRRRDGGREV